MKVILCYTELVRDDALSSKKTSSWKKGAYYHVMQWPKDTRLPKIGERIFLRHLDDGNVIDIIWHTDGEDVAVEITLGIDMNEEHLTEHVGTYLMDHFPTDEDPNNVLEGD